MRSDFEFRCPRCGGSTFGSKQLADGKLERTCHGYIVSASASPKGHVMLNQTSCGFEWHQDDDFTMFRRVEYFDTMEEYEARRRSPE